MRISQQTAAHLATYMTGISPYGKTQIKFKFTNKSAGAEAYEMLKRDYADVCDKDYGEKTPKIFRLGFVDADTRSAVLSEIKQAVAEYSASSGSAIGPKVKTWGIYLAVGILVFAIILFVWKKVRK